MKLLKTLFSEPVMGAYAASFVLNIALTLCSVQSTYSENYNHNSQIPYINDDKLQKMLNDRAQWSNPPPKPINVKHEQSKLNSTYIWQKNWPAKTAARRLGVVSAVAFDNANNVLVFHRGDRVWNQFTFNYMTNVYLGSKDPISDHTIVAYNMHSGVVAYELGASMFYMPHGLTVDDDKNIWVTDVALHQVMKLTRQDDRLVKTLVLGEAFQPGSSVGRFCKPTAVAVLPNGDFFVADGYCNSRIIKYSKTGDRLLAWGKNAFHGHAYDVAPENVFAIPHALTLAADLGVLCVADRENGRVQCFHTQNNTFHSQYHSPIIGDRLFSVAYAPVNGGQLFVVNGPSIGSSEQQQFTKVMGFVIDMQTKSVISKFGPSNGQFRNPHDIIVSSDGSQIYVAELDPSAAYKFISTDLQTYNRSSTKNGSVSVLDAVLNPLTSSSLDRYKSVNRNSTMIGGVEGGSTIVLVASFVAVFTLLIIGLALLISRRRKRGCCPLGNRNRRHAWDFPTVKTDSFKLGSLLDRKRGFEKLNQDASDEEPNATTNMLT